MSGFVGNCDSCNVCRQWVTVCCQLKDSERVESCVGGTLNSRCHKQVQTLPPRHPDLWWEDDDVPLMKQKGCQAGLCEDMQAQSLNWTSPQPVVVYESGHGAQQHHKNKIENPTWIISETNLQFWTFCTNYNWWISIYCCPICPSIAPFMVRHMFGYWAIHHFINYMWTNTDSIWVENSLNDPWPLWELKHR